MSGETETQANGAPDLKSPELIAFIISSIEEIKFALMDIPAQMEMQARASLAQKFIVSDLQGGVTFHRSKFEAVWAAVAGIEQETTLKNQ